MPSFSPFKPKHTLIASLLFSLVGLVLFSMAMWHDKGGVSHQTEQQDLFSSLVVHAGAVIHELEKERTLSAGFLASNGAKFAAELAEQKQRTGEKTHLLESFLDNNRSQMFYGNVPDNIEKNINQSLVTLKRLSTIHQEVDAQKITVKDALDFYANASAVTFDFLVDSIQIKQNLQAHDPESSFKQALLGWVLIAVGVLIAGFVAFRLSGKSRGGSDVDFASSQPMPTLTTGQLPRLLGLHANNMEACSSEWIKVRESLRADVDAVRMIAEDVSHETGSLGQDISAVKHAIEQMFSSIHSISSSAQQLCTNITSIAASSEQTGGNITTVASAAEQITANIYGVNQSLGQVDSSLKSVTQSIHGMTDSLGEVRKRCMLASQASDQVNQHALGSRSIMTELSESAREIGDVVDLINSIAEQTNMLALNASIEAAGAGEAGKGFAVVANEVKELARQTSKATQLIAEKAGDMQQKTDLATQANMEIANGIGRINEGNAEITAAVDEQAKTIQGIASAMKIVAASTAEVSLNAQELNLAAQDVARSALEVANSTTAIAHSASEGARGAEGVVDDGNQALTAVNLMLEAATNTEQAFQRVQEKIRVGKQTLVGVQSSSAHVYRIGMVHQQMSNALNSSYTEQTSDTPLFDILDLKRHALHCSGLLEQIAQGCPGVAHEEMTEEAVCSTCRWFAENDPGQLGEDAFKHHQRLHGIAQEILVFVAQSDRQSALQQLNRYDSVRETFFQALDDWYLG